MSIKRVVETLPLGVYIGAGRPVHMNRVSESFELLEHNHECMEINYVSEGSGYHWIDGVSVPVTKGDLFLLPIGVSHVFRPADAEPKRKHLIVYNILYGTEFSQKLEQFFADDPFMLRLLTSPYPQQPWLHVKHTEGAIQTTIHELFDEFRRQRPDYVQAMQAEMIRLLLDLRRSLDKESFPANETLIDEVIEEACTRIRDRLAEPQPLEQIAAEVGLSERQFRRRFEARTGMNYTRYVQKLRMDYSCQLLVTTRETVSSIAWQAGYRDIKCFNRVFKKLIGVTPTMYRNSRAQM